MSTRRGTFEMIRRANKRLKPEDSVALRVAVTIAVMAAATGAIRQGIGGPVLTAVVLVGLPGANLFSHVTRHREGYLLKAFLAVGILMAFAQFLTAVTGIRPGVVTDVQVPLGELFLWTQFLHALDVPARRDLLYSLVSSLVLIAVAGVLSISMDFALHLVVWAIAAAAALVLVHRSEVGELPTLANRGRPTTTARALRPVGGLLGLVGVLGTLAFLVVPAAGTARALAFPVALSKAIGVPVAGGLANPSLGGDDPSVRGPNGESDPSKGGRESFGYFGFSDTLDTSIRGRPDHTLVMRVRSSHPDFWRGQTFDVWDGRVWSLSEESERTIAGSRPLRIQPAATDTRYTSSELIQTFYIQETGPNMIFAAYAPDLLYFPDNRVFQLSDGSLRSGVQLERGAVYTVISQRPTSTPERLRAASVDPSLIPTAIRDRYLQLPEGMPQRIRDLARDVTASAPTTFDKVRAIEDWLAANTSYTLDIPPLPRGADSVDHFLFEERRGFCEQIGSSLVVMLRSLGVPTRLAVGFAAGRRNPFTGLYEVEASDAHSWAEVWFPGMGWQGFDPTAHVPLAGDAGPQSAGSGLAKYLAFGLPSLPSSAGPALATLAIAIGLGAAAFQLVMSARARRRLAQRAWVTAYLDQVEAAGAARRRPRHPSQTILEYLDGLARSVLPDRRWTRVAETIQLTLFGRSDPSPAAIAEAEAVLRESQAAWPAPARRGARPKASR